MKWASAASVAFVLAVFASPHAAAFTGTDLYQQCQDKKRGIRDLLCIAYVRGFIDGITAGTAIPRSRHASEFCLPEKVAISAEQARLIIEKYLRDHPEQLHEEAELLAATAIMLAFPCKR
jgi:hypothetical protein